MRDYNSKKPSVKRMAVKRPPAKEQPANRGSGRKPSAGRRTPAKSAAKAVQKPIQKTAQKAAQKAVKAAPAKQAKKAENLKIIPIGGLNEIGKNLTVLEYKDQICLLYTSRCV